RSRGRRRAGQPSRGLCVQTRTPFGGGAARRRDRRRGSPSTGHPPARTDQPRGHRGFGRRLGEARSGARPVELSQARSMTVSRESRCNWAGNTLVTTDGTSWPVAGLVADKPGTGWGAAGRPGAGVTWAAGRGKPEVAYARILPLPIRI